MKNIKTIMIIEDEPAIIDQIKSSLQDEEIDIISAANNRDALEILQEKDENSVDLFLINTKTPTSGKKALFSMKPKSKIDITTQEDNFLEKPFTKEQFEKFIRTKI